MCNVNEPGLLWLEAEPECALFGVHALLGVHALATTSALIRFSETVSEQKGYGIVSDNGLLLYLLLSPNLWDIKRMVKRNKFFSSFFIHVVGNNEACVYFTNYLKLSESEKFSFDGIPFSRDNLPAKTQTFFTEPLESASSL